MADAPELLTETFRRTLASDDIVFSFAGLVPRRMITLGNLLLMHLEWKQSSILMRGGRSKISLVKTLIQIESKWAFSLEGLGLFLIVSTKFLGSVSGVIISCPDSPQWLGL
jgi:hypothetical protein